MTRVWTWLVHTIPQHVLWNSVNWTEQNKRHGQTIFNCHKWWRLYLVPGYLKCLRMSVSSTKWLHVQHQHCITPRWHWEGRQHGTVVNVGSTRRPVPAAMVGLRHWDKSSSYPFWSMWLCHVHSRWQMYTDTTLCTCLKSIICIILRMSQLVYPSVHAH